MPKYIILIITICCYFCRRHPEYDNINNVNIANFVIFDLPTHPFFDQIVHSLLIFNFIMRYVSCRGVSPKLIAARVLLPRCLLNAS